VTLTSGLTDFGQGSRTVFSLVAAEVLGVEMERVHMLRPDTRTAVDSGPTVASRASIVGGNATRVAAEKLAHVLRLAAADALDCVPRRVLRVGERYIGPDEEPLSFEEVVDHARSMGMELASEGRWETPVIEWDFESGEGKPYFTYVFGAQVAEVEVNRRTGRVKVLGMWAAHDAGTILFPQGALGQMYGGIAQGLGYALMEGFTYENGVPQRTTLAAYRIPRATDVPPIEATYVETSLPEGPYGAKNLAEPVMVGTAPAVANAVFHATGVRVRELPIDPERLKR
jgi:CO/xanthine dehydrogenase Mo-binding subunit